MPSGWENCRGRLGRRAQKRAGARDNATAFDRNWLPPSWAAGGSIRVRSP
ncbi:hypothetical protein PATSB16_31410 [Pandoraea thiooxydans]|nr:hypothetical protein PATSB16_31410 [Pandoraea thiooxydans]